MEESKIKRYAVLLCADDSEYVKKMYGGYFGVFVSMFGEEKEIWRSYRVASGEFPDESEIRDYDGFVITGSCSDAFGNDHWICRLICLLNKLDSMQKTVLGICFGHQILSRALGGRIGRAEKGWDIGVTSINLSPTASKLFSSLKVSTTLPIIECHRDEVLELPEKAEIIAKSDRTGIEMFKYGDHIMGIQGHPEYTKDILLHLLDRLLQRNYIIESYADEVREKVKELEPSRQAWKEICIGFLKGRL